MLEAGIYTAKQTSWATGETRVKIWRLYWIQVVSWPTRIFVKACGL